jgi:hypothetical protein
MPFALVIGKNLGLGAAIGKNLSMRLPATALAAGVIVCVCALDR